MARVTTGGLGQVRHPKVPIGARVLGRTVALLLGHGDGEASLLARHEAWVRLPSVGKDDM